MTLARRLERLVFKLLRPAYYRWLFGRPAPAGIDRWIAAAERRFGRGDAPVSPADWERQYRGGRWSYLHDGAEAARYEVIAGLLHPLLPGGSLLDVGCGEGILRDRLRPIGYRAYLGIDLSSAALATARRDSDSRDRLIEADAGTYRPEGAFDAIVFNEVLYYLDDPLAAAERYARSLADGGILVISMFDSPRTRAIARHLERRLERRDEVRVPQPRGGWTITVYRAARSSH